MNDKPVIVLGTDVETGLPRMVILGPKRKLRLRWTCSNHKRHSHRWKWTAWLCGRLQLLTRWMRGV